LRFVDLIAFSLASYNFFSFHFSAQILVTVMNLNVNDTAKKRIPHLMRRLTTFGVYSYFISVLILILYRNVVLCSKVNSFITNCSNCFKKTTLNLSVNLIIGVGMFM
jgi:hypothetical protein